MVLRRIAVSCAPLAAIALIGACVGDDPASATPDGGADAAPETTVMTPPPSGDGGDGGGGKDSGGDAKTRACDLGSPWGLPFALVKNLPAPIGQLGSGFASLSQDELTIYLDASVGTGAKSIYVGQRASLLVPFTGFSMVVPAADPAHDTAQPSLTPDGTRLYFTTTAAVASTAAGSVHVWSTPLPITDGGGFANAVPVAGLGAATGNDTAPFATDDELWFDSSRVGAEYDLYRAPITGGVVGVPASVPQLNSAQLDSKPILSHDGLTIFFASLRAPSTGYAIWTSSRPTKGTAFGTPTRVAELESPRDEFPSWISPDGCRLYITSNRDTGTGTVGWIYVSSRAP